MAYARFEKELQSLTKKPKLTSVELTTFIKKMNSDLDLTPDEKCYLVLWVGDENLMKLVLLYSNAEAINICFDILLEFAKNNPIQAEFTSLLHGVSPQVKKDVTHDNFILEAAKKDVFTKPIELLKHCVSSGCYSSDIIDLLKATCKSPVLKDQNFTQIIMKKGNAQDKENYIELLLELKKIDPNQEFVAESLKKFPINGNIIQNMIEDDQQTSFAKITNKMDALLEEFELRFTTALSQIENKHDEETRKTEQRLKKMEDKLRTYNQQQDTRLEEMRQEINKLKNDVEKSNQQLNEKIIMNQSRLESIMQGLEQSTIPSMANAPPILPPFSNRFARGLSLFNLPPGTPQIAYSNQPEANNQNQSLLDLPNPEVNFNPQTSIVQNYPHHAVFQPSSGNNINNTPPVFPGILYQIPNQSLDFFNNPDPRNSTFYRSN